VLIQRRAPTFVWRWSHDQQVIKYARVNISTFETIGASERGRWKRGRSKVFTSRFQRPKDDPDPEDLMDVASRVRGSRRPLSRLQNLIFRLSILALLAGVVFAVGYVFLPGATVVLVPAKQIIEASVDITSTTQFTDIDVENAIFPATTLRLQIERPQQPTLLDRGLRVERSVQWYLSTI
jgi:hypothetical protein